MDIAGEAQRADRLAFEMLEVRDAAVGFGDDIGVRALE